MVCAYGWNYVNVNTNLQKPVTYWLATVDAGAAVEAQMAARLEVNAYTVYGHFMTGRLRLSLWAVSPNGLISANGVTGHLIARAPARMVGGQGADGDRLLNPSTAFVRIETQGTNPPPGTYCMALLAEEETATGVPPCVTQDKFCVNGWYAFSNAVTFR